MDFESILEKLFMTKLNNHYHDEMGICVPYTLQILCEFRVFHSVNCKGGQCMSITWLNITYGGTTILLLLLQDCSFHGPFLSSSWSIAWLWFCLLLLVHCKRHLQHLVRQINPTCLLCSSLLAMIHAKIVSELGNSDDDCGVL